MAEITKTEPSGVPKIAWTSLTILGVAAYFVGLTLPLVGPDEPRYAQVAREMWQTGDWTTPTLGGFTWFEKPALLYWLEIVAYKIFGVTEFAARIGPALFGLGTVAALWILGRRVNNDAAKWFALVAASTLGILVFSHGASFDIIVTFPMTAALVSFFVFDHSTSNLRTTVPASNARDSSSVPLIFFYFFVGISLLAKGLIGIIFPFAIVGFYFVLSQKMPSRQFVISLFWGTALSLVIAGVWYLPAYLKNGWPFIDEFFIQHHFQRFTSNKYQHPQPFYFFLWVLPLMTLPWLPFFFAAIGSFTKNLFHRNNAETQNGAKTLFSPSPLLIFSFSWLLVPLVFFSLSGSKLPGYVLPSVPAAIIITAIYVSKLTERKFWRVVVLSIAAATFVGSIVLTETVVPKFAETESVKALMQSGAAKGLADARVYGLHTVSHSAEFYAAGRLLREADGKQKKLYSPSEVVSEMQRAGVNTALVIVPLEYQHQLVESKQLQSQFLKDNGEVAIYAVAIN